MRIKLNKTSYTQLNTNDTNFVIQPFGQVTVIRSATQPADSDLPDLVIPELGGINSSVVTGIFWAKSSKDGVEVGVLEG